MYILVYISVFEVVKNKLCVCVCVCVCVCMHVYVVYEDIHLYNDMGMRGITRRR